MSRHSHRHLRRTSTRSRKIAAGLGLLVLFAAGSGLIAVPAAAAEVADGTPPVATQKRVPVGKDTSERDKSERTATGPRAATASPSAAGKRSDRPRPHASASAGGTRAPAPRTGAGSSTAGRPGPRAAATDGSAHIESTGQTITFTPTPDTQLSAGTATVAATATSNLTVTFDSATPSVCSVTGTTVTLITLGTCTVNADQAGDGTYDPAPQETDSFEVVKDPQTINWTPTADTPLTDGSVGVTATATSNLTVTFDSATPSVCSVTGTTVTLITLGTCTIDADQAGDGTYDPAPQASDSFEVVKDPQAITFTPPVDTPIADGTVPVSATSDSGLTVQFSSATAGVCSVTGTTVTLISGGTCTINANQAGDATYAAAPTVPGSFQVLKTAQTISFTAPNDQAFSTTPVPLTGSATSSLAVAFSTATPSVCGVSNGAVTLVAVGTCTIDADQAGNGTYAAASTVTDSFVISQASQTINLATPADRALTDGPVTLSPTATSGLTVALASADDDVCTVSGVEVTPVHAGVCTVTADQAGNGNWSAASQVEVSFDVTKGVQAINVTPPGNKALSASPVTLTATATSGLTVAFTAATAPVCTVSGTTVTLLTTGTCTVNANQAGDADWLAAPQVATSFTVAANSQTITFTPPEDTPLSDGPVTVSATATSALAVTFTSATSTVCTVTGTSVTLLTAGTCTVNANQAGNANYAAAPQVSGSFTVEVGAQTITYAAPADRSFTDGPFTTAGTASSGLAVTFASATPAVCAVSGVTVTPVKAGTCTIDADQAGNSNWAAATRVTRSFTIAPGGQTITFTAPEATAISDGPVTVSATATSALTVTFAGSTDPVCTVSGTTVTLVAVGTCTISASQAGDNRYAAAPAVEATFEVLQDPEPVTIPADAPPASDGTLDNTTGATAEPGDTFTLTGSGFKATTLITIVIYSTPQTIGTTTTDSGGAFSVDVALPDGLDSGSHTVVAAGLAPNNTVRYLTQALTVTADADTLATTGGAVTPTVILGAMLIVVGAFLTQAGRNRLARARRPLGGR